MIYVYVCTYAHEFDTIPIGVTAFCIVFGYTFICVNVGSV